MAALESPPIVLRHLLRSLTAKRRAGDATDAAQSALARLGAGDLDGAESAARAALRADPGAAIAHLALGRIALARGDAVAARAALERALELAPDLDAARAELAAIAQRAGRHDDAIEHYRTALARHERSPKLLHALGTALAERGDFADAAATLARALELAPELAPAREALSRTLFSAGRYAEAEAVERAALAREPDAARLHLRLAHALLVQGKMAEGWDEYEWRLRQPGFVPAPRGVPLWDGSDPAGRAMLVVSEQGLGDAMLFARFVPELARRGARVRLLTRPGLERLLRASLAADAIDVTADRTASATGVDAYVPLLSLPRALGLGVAVARRGRYLHPEPALAAAWRERIVTLPRPRIGLAWAGNPARSGDDSRSLAPHVVAPLGAARPDAGWVCLQAECPDVQPRPFAMADWMGSVADFADTAALIGALDLVIAVDTAVAHAAAAVGTPLWVLAPHNVCWRWEIGGEESPWYPQVRLFRARRPAAWEQVIDEIARELGAFRPGRAT